MGELESLEIRIESTTTQANSKINDLIAEMVDIDDDMVKTVMDQIFNAMLQQRLAAQLDQGLRLIVG